MAHGASPLMLAATPDHASGISDVLRRLTAAGQRSRPDDPGFVLDYYIQHPNRISCTVACDPDGAVLGFQSLKLATPGNPYDVAPGWGVIGTNISPAAAHQGIGKALFRVTRAAAEDAGLPDIDATIGADNVAGLAYYAAMGFRTYRHIDGAVCKRFSPKMGAA